MNISTTLWRYPALLESESGAWARQVRGGTQADIRAGLRALLATRSPQARRGTAVAGHTDCERQWGTQGNQPPSRM